MNKKRIGIAGGVLVVVALLVAVVANGVAKHVESTHDREAKFSVQESPRPVAVEPVKVRNSAKARSYPGIIHASQESELAFRVGGPLVEVNVELGKPVRKGTLLMQIDPRDFEDRIQVLEAQLKGAVAVRDNARKDYVRAKRLFSEKVIPQSDFDRAQSTIDSSEATVETLEAELEVARNSLKDTSLVAPFDGTVSAQWVENHEMVDPGAAVVQFHDIRWLEARADIPENEIARRNLVQGMPVWVGFPAAPGKRIEAHLKEWSTDADAQTRTYKAIFGFESPSDITVLPGMSARVGWLDESSSAGMPTVPVSALSPTDDGESTLWIYDDESGRAERRAVKTGSLAGSSRVFVLDGVEENELVVVAGSRLIHEGTPLVAE